MSNTSADWGSCSRVHTGRQRCPAAFPSERSVFMIKRGSAQPHLPRDRHPAACPLRGKIHPTHAAVLVQRARACSSSSCSSSMRSSCSRQARFVRFTHRRQLADDLDLKFDIELLFKSIWNCTRPATSSSSAWAAYSIPACTAFTRGCAMSTNCDTLDGRTSAN
jgi:hypothetical protein